MIRRRQLIADIDIFYTETMEVIDHFKKEGNLIEIDGSGTPEEVLQLIIEALK